MPFIVVIGSPDNTTDERRKIEVLGTHFNVMAYTDESLIRTTLLEGSIRIRQSIVNPDWTIITPGQQAQINQQNGSLINVAGNANVDEVMAWKNGLFQFSNTDIQTLMRQLSRWYDIDVKYPDNVPALKITGKAPRNISLASMLKILALSDVKYQIEGKVLTILP
jgi:ferric-dicitrate binding protein FerR (iron transport regulator)